MEHFDALMEQQQAKMCENTQASGPQLERSKGILYFGMTTWRVNGVCDSYRISLCRCFCIFTELANLPHFTEFPILIDQLIKCFCVSPAARHG